MSLPPEPLISGNTGEDLELPKLLPVGTYEGVVTGIDGIKYGKFSDSPYITVQVSIKGKTFYMPIAGYLIGLQLILECTPALVGRDFLFRVTIMEYGDAKYNKLWTEWKHL